MNPAPPPAADPRDDRDQPPTSAWRRLIRHGSRLSTGNLLVGGLALVLGFAVSTQIRQTRDQGLESLRQSELVAILDTVSQRADRLTDEANTLARTRDDLLSGQAGSQAAVAAARRRLEALEVLAGTVPVVGPGVTVTISDPQRTLGASSLLEAVQELRDAGAEAIQVGSVRVVAATAFTEPNSAEVAVGGVPQRPPYVLVAVGEGQTMAAALEIPGGVVESVRQRGGQITVVPSASVTVRALHVPEPPRYAQPVPGATGPAAPGGSAPRSATP